MACRLPPNSTRRCRCTASTASRRARQIVERLEAKGLLDKIEPQHAQVPHGDRSDVVIEPWLTDQWYVDAKTLAKPAIAAVRDGTHRVRAEELGEDLFRLDGEHPALVRLAPALVGPPDPGLVRRRTARSSSPRPRTRRSPRRSPTTPQTAISREAEADEIAQDPERRAAFSPATRTCSTPGSRRRCGRSRRSAGRTRRRS